MSKAPETPEMVSKAVRKMKSSKAARLFRIIVDMINAAGDGVIV